MTGVPAYPHLWNLMNAWLNQDYDFDHDSDRTVIAEFAQTKTTEDVAATIAELDTILTRPLPGLLDYFVAQTGHSNMIIAEDDIGAYNWLQSTRTQLAHIHR